MQRTFNLTLLFLLVASPVIADTLYDEPRGAALPDLPALVGFQYLGVRFELGQSSQITALHTELALTGVGSSSFFAALVRLPTLTSLPQGNPFPVEELVHTEVFELTGDSLHPVRIPFPVTVDAGVYAVVLGTGLFGSIEGAGVSGVAGYYERMPDSGGGLIWTTFRPTPPYAPWAEDFSGTFQLTVEGVAVPEPSSLALCLGALSVFGWLRKSAGGKCARL